MLNVTWVLLLPRFTFVWNKIDFAKIICRDFLHCFEGKPLKFKCLSLWIFISYYTNVGNQISIPW